MLTDQARLTSLALCLILESHRDKMLFPTKDITVAFTAMLGPPSLKWFWGLVLRGMKSSPVIEKQPGPQLGHRLGPSQLGHWSDLRGLPIFPITRALQWKTMENHQPVVLDQDVLPPGLHSPDPRAAAHSHHSQPCFCCVSLARLDI